MSVIGNLEASAANLKLSIEHAGDAMTQMEETGNVHLMDDVAKIMADVTNCLSQMELMLQAIEAEYHE